MRRFAALLLCPRLVIHFARRKSAIFLLRIFALSLFTAVALAQSGQTAASAPSIPIDQENAHKAQALLDQMVQALGGQAYLSIQDISQEGRTYSFYHGRPNSVGVQFWLFYRYPDKERVEFTKKRDVAYVNIGDKGYEITYKGTRAQEDKDLQDYLRRKHYALDRVIRQRLHEPGVALFYDGNTVAAEKPAERVTILNAKNEGVSIDIDINTHLPLKKSFNWRDPTDKERNVEDEIFDNYRPVQGIMTPFSITRYYNGDMSNQRFLTSVTYNQNLNDSMFQATITYGPNAPPNKK
jgi:hypothetical protein